jgi:hypothetical protein
MTKRVLSITLLAVFAVAVFAENSFAFSAAPAAQPTGSSCHRRNARYQPAYYQRRSRSGSKMRTALRIAAPAALGAGIGVLAGGKKGAAAGALLGGGGGALYHLFKSRQRY